MTAHKIDIGELFLGLQEQMKARLNTNRRSIQHPGSKGDSFEDVWIKWLKKYLPNRYGIDKAIIVDSNGNLSEQIDLVIYDVQYTPFILKQNKNKYIPAEGVYAVFEVKPDLKGSISKEEGAISFIEYAGRKIESVRKLHRTTTTIIDRGELRPARSLTKIIGGILTIENSYKRPTTEKHLRSLTGLKTIDMGCIVESGGFFIDYEGEEDTSIAEVNKRILEYYKKRSIQEIVFNSKEKSLVSFFLQLSRYLQQSIGTVAAIDFNAYAINLRIKIDKEI
jgi:hypothetical protein